ncbi:hypothetical phage protein [Citrobacter phage CR8]|uniref:Hypothetical phage protein n=1 Tax=Citrobacter phage CR8 TaxID=1455076 RepID=W6Q7G2_9CAUD|nr:hypothetical protein CF79_gp27 [Citrobacter phage CR8]EDW9662049.1 hypothetical protein [Salmonella enterica subsp. enterica serovar Newport]CDM21611.1 hypothetical phage protein [Citrobacter phage CR8]
MLKKLYAKLKSKYHLSMAKRWHREATVLSNILQEQKHSSIAWNKATNLCVKHLMKVN